MKTMTSILPIKFAKIIVKILSDDKMWEKKSQTIAVLLFPQIYNAHTV